MEKYMYLSLMLLCTIGTVQSDLDLIDAMSKPEFSPESEWPDVSYMAGSPNMKFLCCVKHNYTAIEWIKDDELLVASDHILIVPSPDKCLELSIVVPAVDDTGYYTCEAKNSMGSLNHTSYIHVTPNDPVQKPQVTSLNPVTGVTSVRLGDNITISCGFFHGQSLFGCIFAGQFQWRRNGTVLGDTYKHTWDNDCDQSDELIQKLTIHDITASDLGDYECFANNSQGNVSRVITLERYKKSVTPLSLPIWAIGVIVAGGIAFLVTTAVISVLMYRRRNSNELEWKDPNVDDFDVPAHKLEYDVFVSYSNDDEDWVKEVLFTKLEEQGYSVNIHFKDFVPGMAIAENIMDAVYKSRKTIVVMSKNFLKSMWGQFELQQAHNRAIAQRTDVLILIKYGKCKVPAKLMGKTFLDWTNEDVVPHFWQRLYEAIGRPQEFKLIEDQVEVKDQKVNCEPECANEDEVENQNEAYNNGEEADYSDVIIDMKKDRGGRNLTKEMRNLSKKRMLARNDKQNDVQFRQKERIPSADEEAENLRLSQEERKPLIC